MTLMTQFPSDVAGLRALIGERLSTWDRYEVAPEPGERRAAVAVTIFDHRDSAHMMVIKRVGRYTNPGHWALPGGRIDAGEGPAEAALRELAEETGLCAEPADVVGILDDFVTLSGYVITPVVVCLPGKPIARRNHAEVASLHPIPVQRLMEPGIPRWLEPTAGEWLLQMPLRHDMVIHAPTGAILWQFAEVALRGRHTRVNELIQPEFTAH